MFAKFLKFDLVLLGALFLLLAISLAILYSITLSQGGGAGGLNPFNRQLVYAVVGLIAFLIFSSINYNVWLRYCNWLYFLGIFLLVAVLVFGVTLRGTSGWLVFGGLNFQSIEFEKVILLIFLAGFFSKKREKLGELLKITISLFLIALPLFLVLAQPDLGSALMLVIIWISIVLLSGIRWKNLLVLFLIGMVICGGTWFLLKDYQQQRIISFVNPKFDPKGSGYNVVQSIVAVGSGGLLGKGLGHGSQSQLNFLPEKHTDFIFASTAEELGFIGASTVLLLYCVVLLRLCQLAYRSKNNFAYLLAIGAAAFFVGHMLVNIGMNMGLSPVTGVPLPLLSYGGSSLVATMILMGIINNVYVNNKDRRRPIDEEQ